MPMLSVLSLASHWELIAGVGVSVRLRLGLGSLERLSLFSHSLLWHEGFHQQKMFDPLILMDLRSTPD